MSNLIVHIRKFERNHDGFCVHTKPEDLYDKPTSIFFAKKVETTKKVRPEEWEENGIDLKEEYWYKYVPWVKGQIMEDLSYVYYKTEQDHAESCRGTGFMYEIIKVKRN